jgi:radical SAM superfamily enzyme YgiQ (UPF0313 family)
MTTRGWPPLPKSAQGTHSGGETHGERAAVFFYPSTGAEFEGDTVFLPLSVMLPAAAVESSGVPATMIDQRVEPDWRERVAREARARPVFFGISAMTGPQIGWGLRAAEIVREVAPDVCIVWGGTHPTVLPAGTLADDRVDAVLKGRGVKVAADLAGALSNGGAERVRGEVMEQPAAERPPGCTLRQPAVDYESYDWQRYVTPVVGETEGLAHVTSRGCPHRCRYCYNRSVNRSRWRGEPAEDVLQDIERLHSLGMRAVLFFDDNFFANLPRVREVAEGIVAKGLDIEIKADCRADYLLKYDDEFLRLLNRAGFRVLYIGAESGSDRILRMVHKDVTVRQLLAANRRLARAEIRPHYSFMAGLPGETERDMRATVRLMLRIKEENPAALMSPVKGYTPYPGTDLFEKAASMGFEPPETLEGWSRFNWNGAPRPWLSKPLAKLVEKLTYATAGIDTQLFETSGLAKNRLVAALFRFYARINRKRCERQKLGPMPELAVIKLARRWFATG